MTVSFQLVTLESSFFVTSLKISYSYLFTINSSGSQYSDDKKRNTGFNICMHLNRYRWLKC
ncbi:MAG: hypothetical protein ACR5LA_00405 [Wolbachia sp.]